MNPVIKKITDNLIERSKEKRKAYIALMQQAMRDTPPRKRLSCGNMAHAIAANNKADKKIIGSGKTANLGIITSYNDMLSAHQPLKEYPDYIKQHAANFGCTAQVAGGVPAMCDGVTQGQVGMELSLFSRDVVAMATAVGLTHNMFDANLFLGICDKIVPGMLIGALQFGHLPAVFVPAGPMPSGLPNKDKAAARQLFAEKKIDEAEMLKVESASYHSPGTCTFYGTANSNQMLMEALGVQLSGSSFEQPNSTMRAGLTGAAVEAAIATSEPSGNYRPLYEVVTEKSLVNAVICLLATGGSTNHCLHLVAIANAAGIDLTWEDIDELSDNIPLLTRIYPNGYADVNHFHTAGGIAFLIRELRSAELLNEDVVNIMGESLDWYTKSPKLVDGKIEWSPVRETSGNLDVLTTVDKPFAKTGGLKLLKGNLGKACIKVSAVAEEHHIVEAPCHIFHTQDELINAFNAGELFKDMIALVRFQGPKANGMPELHKLTPLLGIIQDKGFKVAIVTDGRMSGASGKVPSAIHVSPEACAGGLIGKVQDGDIVTLNAKTGELILQVSDEALSKREFAKMPEFPQTLGRNLFTLMRSHASNSEHGAHIF